MKITIELLPEVSVRGPNATFEAIKVLAEVAHIAQIDFDPFLEMPMAQKLIAGGFPRARLAEIHNLNG